MTIKVVYARSRTPGAWLIRAASWWAQWSHCGLITRDGTVIESRMFAGVVETHWLDFIDRYHVHEIVKVEAPDPEQAEKWARLQLGSGYDWGAIVRFISKRFGLDQSPKRWHCVELVETAITVAGRQRFRRPLSRVTVAQSFMVR